jgi:hypothetical protein
LVSVKEILLVFERSNAFGTGSGMVGAGSSTI